VLQAAEQPAAWWPDRWPSTPHISSCCTPYIVWVPREERGVMLHLTRQNTDRQCTLIVGPTLAARNGPYMVTYW
jgi:hypothetical protein